MMIEISPNILIGSSGREIQQIPSPFDGEEEFDKKEPPVPPGWEATLVYISYICDVCGFRDGSNLLLAHGSEGVICPNRVLYPKTYRRAISVRELPKFVMQPEFVGIRLIAILVGRLDEEARKIVSSLQTGRR